MADKPAACLRWAKERLESYINHYQRNEGFSFEDPDVPQVALVNLDAIEADVTDEDCPDGLMTENVHGKFSIRGNKSLHWARMTANIIEYQIPGFNKDSENLLETPRPDGYFRGMPKNELYSPEELKKRKEPLAYYWRHTFHHDPEVIIEFCKKTPYAIMYPWVAQEIARLRVLNTKNARRRMKKIFAAYMYNTRRKGDTYGNEIAGYFDEYETITAHIGNLKCSMESSRGKRKDFVLKSKGEILPGDSPTPSLKTKFIYFTYNNLRINMKILEEIRNLSNDLRWWIAQFIAGHCWDMGLCTEKKCFHPIVEEFFIRIDQLGEDIELYKKIRQEFNQQRYAKGRHSLVEPRIRNITIDTKLIDLWKPEMIRGERQKPKIFTVPVYVRLKKAIEKVSKETGKSIEELKQLYQRYRIIEAAVNQNELLRYRWDRTPEEQEADRKYIKMTVSRILKADGFFDMD